jgi:hypothetical protein
MCRKELVEPCEDDEEYSSDEEYSEDEEDDDASYDDSINSYQFQTEDANGNPQGESVERFLEFKKYYDKRETDPVISYEQIVNKMMQMGVTPADIMALYCKKIHNIHSETNEDTNNYSPIKINQVDILYRKIARGEIAVNYRDERSYANVVHSSSTSNI